MRARLIISTLVTALLLLSAAAPAAETCRSNAECSQSQYCLKGLHDCYGTGICTDRPTGCLRIYDPVCGCDGQTYSNSCEAAAAGVSVNYTGECTQFCGGFAGIQCPPGQYCNYDACYVPDGGGHCEPIPEICPPLWDPVCGCDGQTYANDCDAAMAQMTVDYPGECSTTTICTDNSQCPSTSYCSKADGDCDGKGQCLEKPFACPEVYDPVCGCDGTTYSNACEAAAAGVNVDYGGPCTQVCGGIAGWPCRAGEYCNLDGCYPDAAGHCDPIPLGCPDVWDPVCGCDGVTYGNACEAAMAQMTVDYEGECSTTTICTDNSQCLSTSYCSKADGDCDGKGLCEEKPLDCPQIYDPVCGCDGTTYSNECVAHAAGVNVDHGGPCSKVCGTIAGIPCDEGEYCNLDGCYPDAAGQCEPIPEICPPLWAPVCGCDGVTYANACQAAMAQVTVAHEGECSTTTPCTGNDQCDAASYCEKDEGDCDGEGVCREKPVQCPEIYDPVCGCDGQTYLNSCEAAAAGVTVNYSGQCSEFCGGIASIPCGTGEYCKLNGCYPDAAGQCETVPLGCPDVWDPVCGCDGVTYGNACEAAMAKMTVDYEGECAAPPCTDNAECPSESYCAKAQGDCDGRGECREKPVTCPTLYDPVCGCDGQTYSNSCVAAAAGVNVKHTGQCQTSCTGNDQCPGEYYCAKPAGDCDASGLCREKPVQCPDVWAPVCGCDGRTYGNDCEAAMAGVNVDYEGECLPPGPIIIMLDPNVATDDIHTGPSGIKNLKILWSEPIVFSIADVRVLNENGMPVPVSLAGNSTEITTITFGDRLIYDIYTITIADSALSLTSGLPIDGDKNGAAGGDAVIVMEHRLRTDADNNNKIDFRDFALWADTWLAQL